VEAPDQILSSAYFPSISWFAAALQRGEILIDPFENYQKQSYRNRCRILSPNGVQDLSIPIRHGGDRKMHSVEISYSEKWMATHWRSMESAYRRSPYFEFFEDDLSPFFNTRENKLAVLNRRSIELVLKLLRLDIPINETERYWPCQDVRLDLRDVIHPKKVSIIETTSYLQVFSDRMDFHSDLSILDLIFNLGPESRSYLEKCRIK
jgi:hypothetical protein